MTKRISFLICAVALLVTTGCASTPETLKAPCDDDTVHLSRNYAGLETVPCDDRQPIHGTGRFGLVDGGGLR